MYSRILRSLIALATVLVAYQAYVLLAVPWLEPSLAVRQGRRASAADREQAALSVSKYQRLLSHYFPADHWSQREPPIVLGNGPPLSALLVLPGYTPGDNGEVEIDQFALLVFPTPIEEGLAPPRDAIVLEAPGGAMLKFDQDFRLDRGQLGQFRSGEFNGPITIRSDMHEPGPEDDLLVETSDLVMNTTRLYSKVSGSPVRFRLGSNVGGGEELEIRFVDNEVGDRGQTAIGIAGIDSLEIRRAVRLRVNLDTQRLLPDAPGSDAGRGNDVVVGQEPAAQPPLDVSCTGPFLFDFVRYVASFDREVRVRQELPSGLGNQVIADQLDIHFAPKLPLTGAAPLVESGRRQQRDLTRLEPVRVVAQGSPALVTSPENSAEARGRRIQLDLRDRRITLDGGRDTALIFERNVLRAPTIEYWHPASEAGTRIGRFRASGPGSLFYVIDSAKPNRDFQAAWQTSVELGRSQGQPVLTLAGRPQLAAANIGTMAANQLTIYFRELSGGATKAGRVPLPKQAAGDDKLQLVPDRMAATGQVEIKSPRLTGRTEEFLATFRSLEETASDAAGVGDDEAGIIGPLMPSGRSAPRNTYHVESDRMQLGIHLRGKRVIPASVACDGHVVFREIPLLPGGPPPLEIRGGQLTASGLEVDAARVTMLGAQPGQTPGTKHVQISGRGMKFLTAAVNIDQRENRLWSDGPGQATILITRDLEGRAATAPYPFDIRWQNGMVFDGRFAVFRGNIIGQGPDDTLSCNQLTAKLAAPIEFGALSANVGQDTADVAEIELLGQVMIDHRSRDAAGPASHERLQQLARLTINQQTGAISGDGPGVIRSTRFVKKSDWSNLGQSDAFLPAIPERRSDSSPSSSSSNGSRLTYFRIEFDGHVVGNLYTREVTFDRRVRTVIGPVDSWERELDALRPETLPSDSLVLECNALSANEDPVAARAARQDPLTPGGLGPIQLRADGNVRIDGRSSEKGMFHAEAVSASFDQGKKSFILKGNSRTPAGLHLQARPGEPFQTVYGDIEYWQGTGAYRIINSMGGQFTPPAQR